MPRTRALLLVVVAGLLWTGCHLLLKPPVLELVGLHLSGVGLGGPTVTATLRVGNPNPYGVRAVRVTYDLVVEGQTAGRGVLEPDLLVPAGEKVLMEFPVEVGWSAAWGGLGRVVGQGRVEARASGVITVRTLLGDAEVPYEVRSLTGDPPPTPGPGGDHP